MKKSIKFIPALATLALLVGCSSTPGLKANKNNIFKDSQDMSNLTVETFQDFFDKLYANNFVTVSKDELLLEVAKTVLAESPNWVLTGTEEGKLSVEEKIEYKLNKEFDNLYKDDCFFENGLFKEELMVQELRASGYNIPKKSNDPFVETLDNRIGYGSLRDALTTNDAFDYSFYEAELTKGIYQELLKEEYILSNKYSENGTYFKNKEVREIEYFKYTPETSTEANTLRDLFKNKVDGSEGSFVNLVETELEKEIKLRKLDSLAKDFALINNKVAETKLTGEYATKVLESQTKWSTDETYGYKDVFTNPGDYDSTEISDVNSKISTYSNSGKKSIYEVYYEKQLEILTTSYYTKEIRTNEDSNLFSSSSIQNALKDFCKEGGEKYIYKNNFLDVYDTNTVVFKYNSDYYIMTAKEITDSSSIEDRYLAAEKLATNSSNVKNCYYHYLTELTSKGKLSIHNQDVYDFLQSNYGYGDED